MPNTARLRFRRTIEVSPFTAHPRIWLTSARLARVNSKRLTNDADWLAVKAEADGAIGASIAKTTIIAASNTNPVVFTTAEAVNFPSTANVAIAGGTGAWAGVNTAQGANVTATKTGTFTFSVPVNSTSFGSFAGQVLSVFQLDGEGTGYIGYSQYGSGYLGVLGSLALVYKILGTGTYRTTALSILDYVNTFGATGNTAPQQVDSGRAGSLKTIGLALAYDWFYSDLSSAQKTATITTLNLWLDYMVDHAYAIDDTTSNYWEAHNSFAAASAYATYEENARGAEWLTWVNNHWATQFAPCFDAPITTQAAYDLNGQGQYYGGLNVLGSNYGGNDIARHVKYFLMVESATGTLLTNAVPWAQRWARTMIHELKPDRYRMVTWGRHTGDYYAIAGQNQSMFLAEILAGTTEGGWAQWYFSHVNAGALPPDTGERLIFYDSSRTEVDYTASEVPYRFADGSNATLLWRSGWGTTADFASLRLSPALVAADIPKDAGHLDLTRGSDYLITQSAMWKGTDDGLTGSPAGDGYAAGFCSTLYFYDGGARCFASGVTSNYDGCQLLYGRYRAPTVKLASGYAFAMQQYESAYDQSAQTPSLRTLQYWIRAFMAMGDGVYVVWDRAKSTAGNHTKQIRWQLSNDTTPTVTAGVITNTVGTSKVVVTTLLPTQPSVELVRNTTQNNGTQFTNWRAQVTDPVPAQTFNVLTALCTMASATTPPTVTRLTTIDSNFVGAVVATATPKVVVLPAAVTDNGNSTFTSTSLANCSFSASHSGTGQYCVAGLMAGTYVIKRGTAMIDPAYVVGADGSASWTSVQGDFTLTLIVHGPQTWIPAPSGAVEITAGASLQTAINNNPAGTTFYLRAGTHALTAPLTPKTGDTFVGEYGAIVDGSGWTTSETDRAAFEAINLGVTNVTIWNLKIQNMPQRGIHVSTSAPAYWTVKYCEVTNCAKVGVSLDKDCVASHNYLHHNGVSNPTGGNYTAYLADRVVFEYNEISYGGSEQKVVSASAPVFRHNYVHHNEGVGIWFDWENSNVTIEYNTVEDNGYIGIDFEASFTGQIRYNTLRRNLICGIFVSTSQSNEIHHNILEDNDQAINYFVQCDAVGLGTPPIDLMNNYAHHNTIRVKDGAGNGSATMLTHNSGCADPSPYLNGSKNNTFDYNDYSVPASGTGLWAWGFITWKTWAEWQALSQDVNGTRTVR